MILGEAYSHLQNPCLTLFMTTGIDLLAGMLVPAPQPTRASLQTTASLGFRIRLPEDFLTPVEFKSEYTGPQGKKKVAGRNNERRIPPREEERGQHLYDIFHGSRCHKPTGGDDAGR